MNALTLDVFDCNVDLYRHEYIIHELSICYEQVRSGME